MLNWTVGTKVAGPLSIKYLFTVGLLDTMVNCLIDCLFNLLRRQVGTLYKFC